MGVGKMGEFEKEKSGWEGREGGGQERIKKPTFSLISKFLFLSSMFLKAIFSDHSTEQIY